MPFQLSEIDREELFRYLGFRGYTPDKIIVGLVDTMEEKIGGIIQPKYVYRIYEKPPFELSGEDIKRHLSGCERYCFFAATLGERVDREIRKLEITSMTEAVIIDAMANVVIEQLCDFVESEVKALYPSQHTTWRFSPGYGDFPLDVQGAFIDALSANKKAGIYVTDNSLLTPRKSVTAIFGLSNNVVDTAIGCEACSIRDKCTLHAEGKKCGI